VFDVSRLLNTMLQSSESHRLLDGGEWSSSGIPGMN
jgi:hypothetical protein